MVEASVNIFISYSHRDEALRLQLEKHLASLKRQKIIKAWHDRKIEAGMDWASQIDNNLNKADIILLLISPDFIFSNYCSEIEMELAIRRHEAGEAILIPIILEPCDWQWLPFGKYQAFPKDAKPITTWANLNEAFLDVIQGIRVVAERLFDQRQQKAQEKKAACDRYLKKVEEILSAEGEISLPGQDTLDELREQLGLTPEEAKTIQSQSFEPYQKYKENLQKYQKTFLKVIEQEYPLSEKSRDALTHRQRDLGIKAEDKEKIENQIIIQFESLSETKSKIQPENIESYQQFSEIKNKNLILNEDQFTPLTQAIGEVNEPLSLKISPVLNSRLPNLEPSPKRETANAISSTFLARCERELTLHIGPMANFIIEDTLTQHPQASTQTLIELLAAEIPNSQSAAQFKASLL